MSSEILFPGFYSLTFFRSKTSAGEASLCALLVPKEWAGLITFSCTSLLYVTVFLQHIEHRCKFEVAGSIALLLLQMKRHHSFSAERFFRLAPRIYRPTKRYGDASF